MLTSTLLSTQGVNHGFLEIADINFFYNCESNESWLTNLKTFTKTSTLVLPRQIHSNKISTLGFVRKCDGLITTKKNTALCIKTADCIPLLIFERSQQLISAVHVGSRGAYRGIVRNIFNILIKRKASEIFISIGPAISKDSFIVQADFLKFFPPEYYSSTGNAIIFDLKLFIKHEINKFKQKLKILEIEDLNVDTATDPRFYSYRRENKTYKRNISFIAL